MIVRWLRWCVPHALLRVVMLVLASLTLPQGATAHSFNESYVYFDVAETTLSGRIEVTLKELAKVLAGDAAVAAPLTPDAVEANFDVLTSYFAERLILTSAGQRYDVVFDRVVFFDTEVGTFAQLAFTVQDVRRTPVTVEMSYDALFADIDPAHRGYALIGSNSRNGMAENEAYISLVFSPGSGAQTLYLNDEKPLRTALTFIEHGIWHIWLGLDHVLFLVTLLVSSVMFVRAGRWEPSEGLRQSLRNTVVIVTVFTLAHTVTLSLATFGIVTLPVVFVEAVIALSIAFVALGNLFPRFHTRAWIVVFVFGLFHGFGFANVLEPLGLDPARKALGLVAFNIGVEIGQIVIVLMCFPVLYTLRHLAAYRLVVMQAGSVALIAVAVFWFVERTYGAVLPAGFTLAGGQ
ncbi:MAG: HupE/UreJ family protein [Pseudomonadota bacterium]